MSNVTENIAKLPDSKELTNEFLAYPCPSVVTGPADPLKARFNPGSAGEVREYTAYDFLCSTFIVMKYTDLNLTESELADLGLEPADWAVPFILYQSMPNELAGWVSEIIEGRLSCMEDAIVDVSCDPGEVWRVTKPYLLQQVIWLSWTLECTPFTVESIISRGVHIDGYEGAILDDQLRFQGLVATDGNLVRILGKESGLKTLQKQVADVADWSEY